jgi:hypothetical protein
MNFETIEINLATIGLNYEKTLVSTSIEVCVFRNIVSNSLYFCRHEIVELAHAGAIRLASH